MPLQYIIRRLNYNFIQSIPRPTPIPHAKTTLLGTYGVSMENIVSQFKAHVACPSCISKGGDRATDNLSVYTNTNTTDDSTFLSAYCFACDTHFKDEQLTDLVSPLITRNIQALKPLIPVGVPLPLKSRKVSKSTCERFHYTWSEYHGEKVQVANFYDEHGLLDAQKIRTRNKHFFWVGNSKAYSNHLFGKHLWSPNPKIGITIVEGEIDCLTLADIQDCKYPVVSILSGASKAAYNALKANKEWLDGFKHITLMFDGDEAGRKAQEECKELFSYDKIRLAQMPDGEDINSLHLQGKDDFIQDLYFRAKIHLPKDIVRISNYSREELYAPDPYGYELPFPPLSKAIRGLKSARLYLVPAGTGLGKSTFVKEIAYYLAKKQNVKIGNLYLEQDDKEAMKDFIAMDNNINPDDFLENPDLVSEEERQFSEAFLDKTMYFFKHFGSLDSDDLLKKIEYMMIGLDCDVIMLDHISMVIDGEIGTGDERKDTQVLMTKLRSLIQRTGKLIIVVVHLRKASGELDYSEGAKVTLRDIKGAGALSQLADFIIALERNQHAETPTDRNITRIKLLKSRRGGKVGYVGKLRYYSDTGRLKAVEGWEDE